MGRSPLRFSGVQLTRETAKKVPEVTVWFWVIKLLTTAMGEATSDYLVHRLDPVIAVILGAIVFAAAMALQFTVRRYLAYVYWLAAAMVAVFGTMAADVMHVRLGVPYAVSVALFAVCLTAVFVAWWKTEGTLSIHSIYTPRREMFYWATVLSTFALGTAIGDMTAITFHLGYFSSGILFVVVFAVPAVAYRLRVLNGVAAFWFAYIATRPLGASFADWMGVPRASGGLNWGRGTVAICLTLVIAVLVGFLTVTRADVVDGVEVVAGTDRSE
jgi:uncharacterized membrane-anchored protein